MCKVADTPGSVAKIKSGFCTKNMSIQDIVSKEVKMEKLRIKLKAYDHKIIDKAALKIVETIKRTGGEVSGPIPLPTDIEKFTILRAVHKYKDSREQFEMRTHKRLIDVKNPSKDTIDALTHLDLPSGVDVQIKTINK